MLLQASQQKIMILSSLPPCRSPLPQVSHERAADLRSKRAHERGVAALGAARRRGRLPEMGRTASATSGPKGSAIADGSHERLFVCLFALHRSMMQRRVPLSPGGGERVHRRRTERSDRILLDEPVRSMAKVGAVPWRPAPAAPQRSPRRLLGAKPDGRVAPGPGGINKHLDTALTSRAPRICLNRGVSLSRAAWLTTVDGEAGGPYFARGAASGRGIFSLSSD